MPELRPYQVESVGFLAGRRRALLAHEMRLGKSACTIVAAHKANASSVLVVCPAIAVPQWEREFERWWPGGPMPRLRVWSYNRATTHWESGLRGTVDVFIPDEAHFAKSVDAKRTKMVYGKDGFGASAGAIWPLSGTPAVKHAGELYPMLRAFGHTGMTLAEFENWYCVRNFHTGRIVGTNTKRIPELREILARFMLRRTRKDVAPEMPDIDFQFLNVEYPAVDLSEDTRATFDTGTPVDSEDRIAVALAKAGPLADEIEFAIGNGLLKQTVVFGWHREPLEWLDKRLSSVHVSSALLYGGQSERERQLVQEQFREGKIQVICANILAAGTAIDLSPASHGYFLELDWVPGNNAQAANRLIRIGKDEKVSFDVVTMSGTVDDSIQKVLLRRVSELARLI